MKMVTEEMESSDVQDTPIWKYGYRCITKRMAEIHKEIFEMQMKIEDRNQELKILDQFPKYSKTIEQFHKVNKYVKNKMKQITMYES